MRYSFLSILLASVLTVNISGLSAQVLVSGVGVPAEYKTGGNSLVLNGAGVRVKFFMDMYVGALYLGSKNGNADAIIRSNDAMVVTIHIVSGLVTSERMADAVKEGFGKSMGGKTAPLQAKIDRFIRLFAQEPIVKGNQFDLVYTPAEGLKVYKGNKLLDTIDGLDFKTALWGIWLGNDPADKGLKAAMLGTK